jgi:serine/threonine-protein kinase
MPEPDELDTLTARDSLTPERFARMRGFFEAALEQRPGQRRAYLEGVCSDDRAMLVEIEGMLAAEAKDQPLVNARSSSSSPEEGRFPAGTLLAGRYRILGMLGKGGMGEVYKAFDLILNQMVALKFLSPAHISEAALVRFRNEVRIARQVSHPHVCRVYDLGMVEGMHFLSMEFIDGEDLASLLRRIGRLPQDKAVEFTRKICAGLNAAHERGVLHRDLKPANIMIDGRGQPRITDFGLAALASEIPLSDLRSGTPAYMSPEQKAGKEVTTRSDIYSLGLVLYEMFTGKARKDTQSAPNEFVKDLDPSVDRLVLRCLDDDPKRRPATAFHVSMALPGANPITAALAAGETPSPEMVAASQEKEGFSPRAAILCFAALVVWFLGSLVVAEKLSALSRAPLPIPPDALADRAQQFLQSVGYLPRPDLAAYGFWCCDVAAYDYLTSLPKLQRLDGLARYRPPVASFYYRQQSALSTSALTRFPDEQPLSPGLIRLQYDPVGRLLAFEALPVPSGEPTSNFDWSRLFSAAGLDIARFTAVSPANIPSGPSDSQTAWEGSYGEGRPEHVRVEAVAWRGRPVEFFVRPVEVVPKDLTSFAAVETLPVADLVIAAFVLAGASLVALRNLRQGRSDPQGARTVTLLAALLVAVVLAFAPAHLVPISPSLLILTVGACWIFYIAVEPAVRRNWPDSLISWSRMCSGKVRNPLVASHILAGLAAGMAFGSAAGPIPFLRSIAPDFELPFLPIELQGLRYSTNLGEMLASWSSGALEGVTGSLALLAGLTLFRSAIKTMWLADFAAAVMMGSAIGVNAGAPSGAIATIEFLMLLWMLRRLGFLS